MGQGGVANTMTNIVLGNEKIKKNIIGTLPNLTKGTLLGVIQPGPHSQLLYFSKVLFNLMF